ncbi:MAG TPA: beta-propeller fold lactonase family protein, partial [Steroidobacter sp.]|nr:beta-propeller fold lactonase family protein [Steroidobacter sp.]
MSWTFRMQAASRTRVAGLARMAEASSGMREVLRTARGFFGFAWYVLSATLLGVFAAMTTSSSAQAQLAHTQTIRYDENNAPSLSGVKNVIVSPDGRFVYALTNGYDSISYASRTPATGLLNPGGWVSSGGVPEGWYASAMSADGRFIYLGTVGTNTVRVYSRDANGNLTSVQSYTGGGFDLDSAGFLSLAVSPDGRFLYGTTGQVAGLVVFARDVVNGTLTLVQEHVDGVDGNLLGQSYGDGDGPMNNIAFSSDGAFMYVTASEDDALNVYARDADTGVVMLQSTLVNNSDGVVGLDGVTSVVISPDDRFVYAAGKED